MHQVQASPVMRWTMLAHGESGAAAWNLQHQPVQHKGKCGRLRKHEYFLNLHLCRVVCPVSRHNPCLT
eukprot:scaffold300397_cov14-Tisochrysis_lutea.AAC.1